MITAPSPLGFTASVVAVVASGVFLAIMLRHQSDPTTRPFLGIAASLLLGGLIHIAVVNLQPVRDALGIQLGPTAIAGGPWTLIAFDIPAVVGICWFLFALQYTGRDRKTSPIVLVSVAVLLLLVVGPSVALAVLGGASGVPASTFNAVLGITIILAESLALIGVFVLFASTLRHKAFPISQTALLTLAVGAVLVLPFVATTLQTPVATPMTIATSALLFTAAVRRYRLFETLPVVSLVGRDRVIDEMAEGVVIVSEDGRIRDLNARFRAALDIEQADVLGEPLASVATDFPDPEAATGSGPKDVHTDGGRILAVTADAVTDNRGRTRGHLFVCRDVTRERRREHRLGVLTQLVAGATTTQMERVSTIADDIVAGDRVPKAGGDSIVETATDTATLVARVRGVEQALASGEPDRSTQADLSTVVENLEASVDAEVAGPADGTPIVPDSELLTAVLDTLATAAGASSDSVALRVRNVGDHVTVALTPYEYRDAESIPALALDVALLAADYADWWVGTTEESGVPTVVVRLPAAHGTATPGQSDGGSE